MRLPAGAIFLVIYSVLPLFSQGVVVEVVDYLDNDIATPSFDVLAGSTLNNRMGGGGGSISPKNMEIVSIQEYWTERRGGNWVHPATTGCGPVVLNWNRQVSKSTLISGSLSASYVATIQGSYGVTDTITVTTGGSFELPRKQCGYIVGKEGLRYAEFYILKNSKRIGSGAIQYLQDVQIVKNFGTFQP